MIVSLKGTNIPAALFVPFRDGDDGDYKRRVAARRPYPTLLYSSLSGTRSQVPSTNFISSVVRS